MQIKPLETPVDCIFLIEYLLAMAAEIFLPCYCGSLLIVASDDLSRALYRCDWTTQSGSDKASMGIFMERAKQPILMHIYGKFCMIHLGAFVNVRLGRCLVRIVYRNLIACLLQVTRFAYTLLAFLKSFQEN